MQFDEFKAAVTNEFEMTDFGLMKYFTGIEVEQSNNGIFISQHKYATDVLKKFKTGKCKSVDTPIEVGTKLSKYDVGTTVNSTSYKKFVGSIMYLTATRPDITYETSYISRFMESPNDCHCKVGKGVLRYITGTTTYVFWYTTSTSSKLIGYTYNDFVGWIDDNKSTSRYAFLFDRNFILFVVIQKANHSCIIFCRR